MKFARDALRSAFAMLQYASLAWLPICLLRQRIGRTSPIPVLAYHKVVATPALARALTCAVTVAEFARHMTWLNDLGFRPLTLETYVQHVLAHKAYPRRSVLITFDDGYRSVFTCAYPILRRWGFPATVFLITDHIGQPGVFPADQKYAGLPPSVQDELVPLTWEQVREMSDLITPASHTVSHPHLARLARPDMDTELTKSRAVIAALPAGSPDVFAYPHGIRHHGDYSDETRAALIAAGYRVAFNSEIGRNSPHTDPYAQRRIEPKGTDPRLLFLCKLTGAYDWVGWAQSAFHRVFSPGNGGTTATAPGGASNAHAR